MNAVVQEFGPCPCSFAVTRAGVTYYDQEATGCGAEGTKLTRFGHLVGCTCRSCMGRRNKRKGAKGNSRAHRRLGGTGIMVNDDLYFAYSVNLSVESKTGAQIPASFWRFIDTDWAHRAFHQADKKRPVGADAYAAVYMERTQGDWYVVVKGDGRGLRP